MNAKTVLLFALVGLVTTAGMAAAQPVASPDTAATDDRHGPPDQLPGPVPEFVGHILDLIDQQLSGALSGVELGDALAGLLGDTGGSSTSNGQTG